MFTDLTGSELAEHLAKTLTDLEFELLLRKRIEITFSNILYAHPNLYDSHHSCQFKYSWNDKCEWYLGVGETYSKTASARGEVLSATARDISTIYGLQESNKLSKLLPPPTE